MGVTLVAFRGMPMHNFGVSYRVGIINVTGYAGMEAARLLWKHPHAQIVAATGRSLAGKTLAEAFPSLRLYDDLPIKEEIDAEVDIVFSALPTAESAKACAPFVNAGVKVIDIAADFRLKEPGAFEQWMSGGNAHPAPELLKEAVYGLPELNGERIAGARLVANPGCYPAASILALAPAYAAGFIRDQIVVDAKSGISGAGRGTGGGFSYAEVNEDVSSYKIASHNHQPEIQQELGYLREGPGPKVTFVPPLAWPERPGWCCLRYLTRRGINMVMPQLLLRPVPAPLHGVPGGDGRHDGRHDARGATTLRSPARERVPCW